MSIAVDRPVATFMVVLAVAVFGYVSVNQMPVDLMPELSYPTVTVRAAYEGAAPQEVEDEVVEPLEDLLRTVEGVVSVTSVSRAGGGDVLLRFQWNTSLDTATQKVRERIGLLEFPDGVEPPSILRYDPTLDPILRLAVAGDMPLANLRSYAEDELRRDLEKLPGVAMVRVFGGEERVVRVSVDERRLDTLGIDIGTISERLRSENVNVAGGRLYEGDVEYLVRTVNEFDEIEDIESLVIAVTASGLVRLRDVATVTTTVRDREVITRVDGVESIELAIFKEADANLVSVAEAIKLAVFGPDGPDAVGVTEGSGIVGADVAGEFDERGGSGEGSGADVDEADAEEEAPSLLGAAPDGVSIVLLSDQSSYIRAAVDEVRWTAIYGGGFAVLVLFVFLRRPYPTLVIALAIPLSVIATFAPMRWMGVSLNVMSLGGLALGIGMLVDNAIVVLEAVVRRQEAGETARDAAINGTAEVGGAVAASTLTTVAVFFPIVFVEGVAGQLFGDLAIAVVLSLLASLAFALFFVPMMLVLPTRGGERDPSERLSLFSPLASWVRTCSDWRRARIWARGSFGRRLLLVLMLAWVVSRGLLWGVIDLVTRVVTVLLWGAVWLVRSVLRGLWHVLRLVGSPLDSLVGATLRGLEAAYARILSATIVLRWLVIVAAGAAMWWTVITYPTVGLQLIPELQQGEFTAEVRLPVGSRLPETVRVVEAVERALADDERVLRVASFVGRNDDDLDASDQGEHTARLTVTIVDGGAFPERELQVMEVVRAALSRQPAVRYELTRPTLFSLEAPIAIEIQGEDLQQLADTADAVAAAAQTVGSLRDVRSNIQPGFPEVQVRFQRDRLAALGLDVRQVAETTRDKVLGTSPTELRPDERSIDVEVRVNRDAISTIRSLEDLVVGFVEVDTPMGGQGVMPIGGERRPVRLGSVAEFVLERGPSEIRHIEGQRAAIVTASTNALDISAAVAELNRALSSVRPAHQQTIRIAGQSEEMKTAQRSLALAMLLAVFLVYVVMASKFESLLAPVVILGSVPLALVGVIAVLVWQRTPLSVVVFIGVIVLVGIVVNNAIVLVDTVLQNRRNGLGKSEAIVEAGRMRLRPVLITATTTILGLLPMALAVGEGAEIRRPLAWVVIGGLSFSTLLTLIVIPALYHLGGELFGTPRLPGTAIADGPDRRVDDTTPDAPDGASDD
ncbi:MAG: HAE1 family hydrophobic/amphiphilic exporter-1 [Bradymonadia bacterium]